MMVPEKAFAAVSLPTNASISITSCEVLSFVARGGWMRCAEYAVMRWGASASTSMWMRYQRPVSVARASAVTSVGVDFSTVRISKPRASTYVRPASPARTVAGVSSSNRFA